MTDRTLTIVLTRVLRGRGWAEHRDRAGADLHAQAVARAAGDGLALTRTGDVVVHTGSGGLWARLTYTATARHHHEDDGESGEGGGDGDGLSTRCSVASGNPS